MKKPKLTKALSLLMALALALSLVPATALATEDQQPDSSAVQVGILGDSAPEEDAAAPETSDDADDASDADNTGDIDENDDAEDPAGSTDSETPDESEQDPAQQEPEQDPAGEPEQLEPQQDPEKQDPEQLPEATALADLTISEKPGDGTTSGQPFESGAGGSKNFRIPALVTLPNGNLVAAADARWDTTADGYGLDTIVSRSTDNGSTWNYTFANYLGDNGNVSDGDSTAFIDPCLAVDKDGVIYMLVDLYPHGTYIGNVKAGTGFDDDGNLLLKKTGDSAFNYYLKDGVIYDCDDGGAETGYTVDEYFNITTANGETTNLFFSNSPYQVLPTSYLYLTTSADGGKTWSAPMMLNPEVKNNTDKFYGVGPGRGLVTSKDRIIFPCYTYTSADGNTSVIYSDDGGDTWIRSADMSSQSSEATLVEADGRIYMFTRHGGYYVSEDDGATWSEQKSVGVSYTTTCQLSAITYSQKIDGKTAILLSAPTSGRTTGKIFVGLVETDGSISWEYTYAVNGSGAYAYSCLTELKDGSIGLLYENASASITYTSLSISEIASGAVIGDVDPVVDKETGVQVFAEGVETVAVTPGEAQQNGNIVSKIYSIFLNDGKYTDSATVKIPYDNAFDGCTSFSGFVTGADGTTTEFTVTLIDGYFVCKVPHFSEVGIQGVRPQAVDPQEVDVTLYVGQSKTVTNVTGANNVVGINATVATADFATNTVENNGGVTTAAVPEFVSGATYLLQNVRSTIFLANTAYNSNTLATTGTTDNIGTLSNHQWTITAVDGGYYVQDSNGKYLTIGNGTSGVTDTPTVLNLAYNTVTAAPNTWTIGEGSYYLNNPASSKVNAAGWTGKDNGSCWNIYPISATEITFTGVAAGITTATAGSTTYNITVKEAPDILDFDSTPFVANTGVGDGKAVTKLTTSVGLTFDLDLNVSGSNIQWSVADTSIATVDQNGNVTGVKAGETTVTATVNGVAYTIPVVIRQDTTSSSIKIYDFYLSEVTDTTVYYSVSMSTDLVEAQEGEVIYISTGATDNTAVDFFAKPNDGYALTRMSSTNSAGDYMALNSDTPSQTDFCTKSGAAGSNQINTFGSAAVYAMVQAALDKDCDGGMGWTRPSSDTNGVTSDLTFRSEKLPTVFKEVATVNGQPYTEGMLAHAGEKVVFNVTVTQYAAQDNITYSNASLKDNLSGAIFAGTNSSTRTVSGLSNTALTANKQITYQVEYTITDDDLDKTIVNTVDLTYTYKSQYSSGSFGGTANADAKITAASFNPKDIVIDFGLPVTIDYSGTDAHGRYDLASGVAKYGDVTVSGNKVTYTPKTILPDVDIVTLTNTEGGTYTFNVYPATTVYYEEGFAQMDGFTSGSKGTGTQTCSFVGDKANYGYQKDYNRNDYATSSAASQSATFTFTGTGVDVYTYSTPNSGRLSIQVKDSGSNTVKLLMVDTKMKMGTTGDTGAQAVSAGNIPVASITGLRSGTYTVKVTHIKNADGPAPEVYLDGFKVYYDNTYADIYAQDNEANPTYAELRNAVLASIDDTTLADSQYADKAAIAVAGQVYASGEGGAVILEAANNTVNGSLDLLDNGPKNELYLSDGQTVAFKVEDAQNLQVGLRILTGEPTVTINGKSVSLTDTDMFYPVNGNGTVSISVSGNGIAAITKVKNINGAATTIDGQSLQFAALTAEDLTPVLLSLGYEEEPAQPEQPSKPDKPSKPDQPAKPDRPGHQNPVQPGGAQKPGRPVWNFLWKIGHAFGFC